MSTTVCVYSTKPLPEPRGGLEDDLEELLAGAGEVSGGGGGAAGWNIDLELFDDLSADQWIDRLAAFLREWGVPEDTSLKVFSADGVEGDEPQQVSVYGD
jgi:hypothetical protein